MKKIDRPWQAKDDTVWHVLISRWLPKATNTHSQNVIFIAFPLQIWIYEMPQGYVILKLPILFLPNIGCCSSSSCLKWSNVNHIIDIIVLNDKITDKHLMVMEGDVRCYGTLAT